MLIWTCTCRKCMCCGFTIPHISAFRLHTESIAASALCSHCFLFKKPLTFELLEHCLTSHFDLRPSQLESKLVIPFLRSLRMFTNPWAFLRMYSHTFIRRKLDLRRNKYCTQSSCTVTGHITVVFILYLFWTNNVQNENQAKDLILDMHPKQRFSCTKTKAAGGQTGSENFRKVKTTDSTFSVFFLIFLL